MEDPSIVKTRKRKVSPLIESSSEGLKLSSRLVETPLKIFDDIANKIQEAEVEFTDLQKEIQEVRELWQRERSDHERSIIELKNQETAKQSRQEETWAYEFSQKEKRTLEELNEKKLKWEKELEAQKEVLENERRELTELRQRVEKFEGEKERTVKEASAVLAKDLNEKYQSETRLRDQTVSSQKEILDLKIAQLTVENTRLTKELETVKKSLDEASRQLKEVALKVIESGSVGASKTGTNSSPSL